MLKLIVTEFRELRQNIQKFPEYKKKKQNTSLLDERDIQ